MNDIKQIRLIEKFAVVYHGLRKSDNMTNNILSEDLKKAACYFIIEYAFLNGLVLMGFDFKRFKTDKEYKWYDVLDKILKSLYVLEEQQRMNNISPDLYRLFEYMNKKFENAD